MQHHPIESFVWQTKVAQAELPLTTKAIAMFLAHFANADGSRVRPGERLLAAITGLTERAVRQHLAALREIGLIERVEHGKSRGRADVYQLTLPGGPVDTVPRRLDERWNRLEPAVAPKRRCAAASGSSDPVDISVDEAVDNVDDRNTGAGSGEPGDDGYRNAGAALPEAGSASTGTPVPPTNQTYHHQPFHGLPQVGTSPAATNTGEGRATAEDGFKPTDAEYAAAHEILMSLPDMEPHMTAAVAELAAAGIADPTSRQLVVRAADIATRPTVADMPAQVSRVSRSAAAASASSGRAAIAATSA
jgi:DNA-binding transcriptional ArsR family regulator